MSLCFVQELFHTACAVKKAVLCVDMKMYEVASGFCHDV